MFTGLKAIPAFNGAGSGGSGAGGSLTLTLVGTATANAASISMPSGTIVGDWAILLDAAESGSGSSITSVVPSGWTSIKDIYNNPSGALRLIASQKVLTSTSSVTGMSSGTKFLLVFRPSSAITTVTASTWNGEVTAGNPTSQTVSASGVSTPLIVLALAATQESGAAIPAFVTETPSMTNLTNDGPSGGPECRMGYTLYNSSPSDQSIDTGDNGAVNGLISGYVRFT